MQKFKEVLFTRTETKDQPTPGKITVTFNRVRQVKEVAITQAQADTLNAGKTTCRGNIEFTLLLREGEADPAEQILETRTDSKLKRKQIKF